MIGKIILTIIFILIFTVTFVFMNEYLQEYTIKAMVGDYSNTLCEKISTEGVVNEQEYENFKNKILGLGKYKVIIKLEKKITEDISKIYLKENEIVGNSLMKGDVILIIIWDLDKEKIVSKKVSYIISNHNQLTMGYEIIEEINNTTMLAYEIEVKNLYQEDYRNYSCYENSIYGDDLIESENNEAHIYYYSRYFKRNIHDENGNLVKVQYSQRKMDE